MPVGGGSKAIDFGSELPPDQDYAVIDNEEGKSLEERLLSKKFATWGLAYEELAAKFKDSQPDPELISTTAGEMKKYLIDSHHQSLEKALELYVSYLKVADKSVVVEN